LKAFACMEELARQMEHEMLEDELGVDVLAQLGGGCGELRDKRMHSGQGHTASESLEIIAPIDMGKGCV